MTVGGWFLMRYLEWRSEKLDHSRGQVVGTNLSAVCGMDDFCKILCSVTWNLPKWKVAKLHSFWIYAMTAAMIWVALIGSGNSAHKVVCCRGMLK